MNEQIDWSKAPEDAEAGYLGTSQAYDAWYKRDANGEVMQICSAAGVNDWFHMGGRKDFPVGAVLRAVTTVFVANAETLPYLGQPVEFLSTDLGEFWCDGKVSYVGPKFIVVTYAHPTAGESEACMNHAIAEPPLSTRIRPVRTPEQKRLDAIDVMCKDCGYDGGGASFYTCAGLYDAGYRKQVQP